MPPTLIFLEEVPSTLDLDQVKPPAKPTHKGPKDLFPVLTPGRVLTKGGP